MYREIFHVKHTHTQANSRQVAPCAYSFSLAYHKLLHKEKKKKFLKFWKM